MSGYVYFIRPISALGPIKIGHSIAPSARLGQVQYQSPCLLEIIAQFEGDKKLERTVQNSFADFHSHGEWFHPGERLLRSIAALQQGVSYREAIDITKRGNVLGMTAEQTMRRNGTARHRRKAKAPEAS